MSAIDNIQKISDLFAFIEQCSDSPKNLLFRGVRKCSYDLKPSIGRYKTSKGKTITVKDEQLMLKLFKQKAYPFIKEHIKSSLALLSMAQHHGIVNSWPLSKESLNGVLGMIDCLYRGRLAHTVKTN